VAVDDAGKQELYEEDLTASMPHREEQWREMEAYTQRLGEAAEEREPYAADFSSEEAYLRTSEPLRELLRARTGYPPPGLGPAGEVRMEAVGEDRVAKYYRCWVEVTGAPPRTSETPEPPEAALHAYGLYLVPQGLSAPAPLIFAQHGGGGTPETAIFQGGANYHDMIRGAAARGYVVFAPHLVFNPFSDQAADSPLPPGVRSRLDARLRLLGTSLTAVEVAKVSRALDALLLRPEIDPARVALACPRPLQVQVGEEDAMFRVGDAQRLATRAAAYYDRLGVGERFEFVAFEGGHEWRGDVAWRFLARWL